MDTLRLGTRGSELALFQANAVAALLTARIGVRCEIVVIKTSGDRLAEAPLSQVGGKRLFVKEIEDALIAGAIDAAVHSSKDMPALLPAGLALGAVLPREDARDAVVLPRGSAPAASLEDLLRRLGETPHIGTSSIRRTAQLLRILPNGRFAPVRGNLDTRLRKLDSGDFEALVLAAAGLNRLGYADRISSALPADACVPAPGQGIVAVEIRSGDARVRELMAPINDAQALAALNAERAVVTRLGGGCQMPLGAYAVARRSTVAVTAVVLSLDGSRVARAEADGAAADPHAVGVRAAEQLLAEGAADILAEVQRGQGAGGRAS
jgi:hydroxymethylbilane synthase